MRPRDGAASVAANLAIATDHDNLLLTRGARLIFEVAFSNDEAQKPAGEIVSIS
jgi:hypothetical protein